MSIHSSLKNLAISETGFVFDPYSGTTFTVNPTGLAVLTGLRDGLSTNQIVESLKTNFDGATNESRDDVVEFVQLLRQHGLVPPELAPTTEKDSER